MTCPSKRMLDNLRKIRELLEEIDEIAKKPEQPEEKIYTRAERSQSFNDAWAKLEKARDEAACKELQKFAKPSSGSFENYSIAYLKNDPSYHYRCVDNKGYTPVMNALSNNNEEALKVLTSHGFDVNHPVKDGKTMLHLAVDEMLLDVHNSVNMVEELLALGADYSILDNAGQKAFDPLLDVYYSQSLSWPKSLELFNEQATKFSKFSPLSYKAVGEELHAKVDADSGQVNFHDEM